MSNNIQRGPFGPINAHPLQVCQHLAEQLYGVTIVHPFRVTKVVLSEESRDGVRFAVMTSHHELKHPPMGTTVASRMAEVRPDVRRVETAYGPGDVVYTDCEHDYAKPRVINLFIDLLTKELADRDAKAAADESARLAKLAAAVDAPKGAA